MQRLPGPALTFMGRSGAPDIEVTQKARVRRGCLLSRCDKDCSQAGVFRGIFQGLLHDRPGQGIGDGNFVPNSKLSQNWINDRKLS